MGIYIAKMINAKQFIFVAWNGFWWNYHVNRARLHDDRIQSVDPEWREKL